MSSGKILLGILTGVAVGGTLGILFAPDKGSKTRKKIAAKGGQYADELKEKFDKLSNVLSEKFEHTRKDSDELLSKTKREYNPSKKRAANAAI
jgi:gas vesicle protein